MARGIRGLEGIEQEEKVMCGGNGRLSEILDLWRSKDMVENEEFEVECEGWHF